MQQPSDLKFQDVRLLSLDVDNTLIDLKTLKGSFTKTWNEHRPAKGMVLTYNTGRLIDNMLKLISNGILPEPDYIIAGVGTHIYDYKNQSVVKEFDEILDEGWNLDIVESIIQNMNFPIELQPGKFQHAYKRSYFFHDAREEDIHAVERRFQDAKLDVNIVYSDDKFLDILPKWANKGNALQWLLNMLNISAKQVVVAGDSGNDAAMFNLKDIRTLSAHQIPAGISFRAGKKRGCYRRTYLLRSASRVRFARWARRRTLG